MTLRQLARQLESCIKARVYQRSCQVIVIKTSTLAGLYATF